MEIELVRIANTTLIKLIPNEWISDYHLDSYGLKIFDGEKYSYIWIGDNK